MLSETNVLLPTFTPYNFDPREEVISKRRCGCLLRDHFLRGKQYVQPFPTMVGVLRSLACIPDPYIMKTWDSLKK